MSTIDTKAALSVATLLNAIQLPVVIADLVLGEVTKEELMERATVKCETSKPTDEINDVNDTSLTIGDQQDRRDAVGSHQLASNQVARQVMSQLKFK